MEKYLYCIGMATMRGSEENKQKGLFPFFRLTKIKRLMWPVGLISLTQFFQSCFLFDDLAYSAYKVFGSSDYE